MTKILALLLSLTILSFVKADDVSDNALEDGEEIYLDPEVGEGQVDNMNVESADDDLENETATWDIEHTGPGPAKSTQLLITFRKKYTAKDPSKRHKENTKKTPEEFWFDLIKPIIKNQNIVPLDGSKDLVELVVGMNHYIKIDCNFHSRYVKEMVKELKHLKEVLVVEFWKKNE